MSHLSHIDKDKKIYGNCQVLSPDGILMFRCHKKKINWYLKRDLGVIEQEDPLTIRLKFEPKGLGNHQKPYGLSNMENECVVCGDKNYLTKHHVVPHVYRKFFPLEIKSHSFHDVLSVCVDCHEEYERFADDLKFKIANDYNVPVNGIREEDKDLIKIIKKANILLRTDLNIPKIRLRELKKDIKEYFGYKKLTQKRLKRISVMEFVIDFRHYGELVVEQIPDIQEFIEMWRSHFIEHMDCKYLPENWSVEN